MKSSVIATAATAEEVSEEHPIAAAEPSFLTNRDDPKKRIWLKAQNYGNFEQKYC